MFILFQKVSQDFFAFQKIAIFYSYDYVIFSKYFRHEFFINT